MRPGSRCRPSYWRSTTSSPAVTAAAEATRNICVASGICLIVERNPINTANEVASVDHLSGGRLEFGVGAGCLDAGEIALELTAFVHTVLDDPILGLRC